MKIGKRCSQEVIDQTLASNNFPCAVYIPERKIILPEELYENPKSGRSLN